MFELVVWVFFIECGWQKDNTLSPRSIHLRFQVAPGEFNLESVGLDTLVINQLHPRVCLSGCVHSAICLCLCVINHCLFLYRTHNGRVSFSQLKINSSWSDSLTIAGQENKIVLRQMQHNAQWDQSVTGVIVGNGCWKRGICHKRKVINWLRVSSEKGTGTHNMTRWIIPHLLTWESDSNMTPEVFLCVFLDLLLWATGESDVSPELHNAMT